MLSLSHGGKFYWHSLYDPKEPASQRAHPREVLKAPLGPIGYCLQISSRLPHSHLSLALVSGTLHTGTSSLTHPSALISLAWTVCRPWFRSTPSCSSDSSCLTRSWEVTIHQATCSLVLPVRRSISHNWELIVTTFALMRPGRSSSLLSIFLFSICSENCITEKKDGAYWACP